MQNSTNQGSMSLDSLFETGKKYFTKNVKAANELIDYANQLQEQQPKEVKRDEKGNRI